MEETPLCPHPSLRRRTGLRPHAGLLAMSLAVGAGVAISAAPPTDTEKAAPARTAAKKPAAKKKGKPAVSKGQQPGSKTPGTPPAGPAGAKAGPTAPNGQPGTAAPGQVQRVAPGGKGTGAPVAGPGAPGGAPAAPGGAPAVPGQPMPAPAALLPVAAAAAPPGMLRMDFRGTDVDQVLQAFALAYKWTVVKDPGLTGPVTVIETEPMDRPRALKILQALLEVRGYTALLDGSILKVMPLRKAIAATSVVRVPSSEAGTTDRSEVVTEVVPLSNAEAGAMAKDLEPLLSEGAKIIGASGANALIITDVASNIERLKLIIGALDKGAGNNEMEIFHLKHIDAKQMVEIVNNLFKQIAPRQSAPMPMPGQPGFNPGQPGMPMGASQGRPAVAAVADDRTNSVIVVGSADNLKRVREVVKQLDEGLNPHTETQVYEVKYADAQKLAQLVNDALLGGQGSGGQPQQPQGFFNPFERRAQGTASTSFSSGQTHIVADPRTNTLVITADADIMKTVQDLLVKLDKPVEYETTTFAIPLKNVNSDDMAYVLAQAFGTQQQNGGFGGFFGGFFGGGGGGSQSRIDRRIKRRLNNTNNNNGGFFGDAGGSGPTVASAGGNLPATGFRPDDPRRTLLADASRRELPPGAEELAQFFYNPYGYGRGGSTEPSAGRNSSGKYVNLLQLRGNVLVTPERNTNSLIITTTPENAQAVKDLVAQLDVETKQVLMEAIVAEVSLDKTTKFGIDYLFRDARNKLEGVFPVLPSTGPLGADALASGLRYTIVRGNLNAVLTAIGTDDKVKILSTPRIFTSNNQEAEIEITQRLPYLAGNTIGFGSQTSTSVDFVNVGLILNVTPRITADGMVTVDVYQEDSNLVQFRNVGQNAVAPQTAQRVTDTSVTLKDGDTLVLSGLQRNTHEQTLNKIPFLGDIPVIGNLFRSKSKTNSHTELVVFLTPRVVNNADEGRSIGKQELERIQKKLPGVKSTLPKAEPEGEMDRREPIPPDDRDEPKKRERDNEKQRQE